MLSAISSIGAQDNERTNLDWFAKDATRQSLKGIQISNGELRGLKRLTVNFNYPMTAVAGKNGSGKTTLLALAACAFHNNEGWHLPDRNIPYYRFSDFFIQASGEVPLDGITVRYAIHHNNWKTSDSFPNVSAIGIQERKKNQGGRWTDYDKRVHRPVAYFGIDRVVPHSEKSVFRSYRYRFAAGAKSDIERQVCDAVSRTLGTIYDDFESQSHGKYKLPWVSKKGTKYSGFNMGAGEKALFELWLAIFSAPDGVLFLIDEIELGLHEQAQKTLIRELTKTCLSKKIQLIFTTHSPTILAALPPEARVYIEKNGNVSSLIPGISPRFAAGRLSGENSNELTIYVEDRAAEMLCKNVLTGHLSSRASLCSIGSWSAVISMLAARYLDKNAPEVMALLDGDQRKNEKALISKFMNLAGKTSKDKDAEDWVRERLHFLPGTDSPEVLVLTNLRDMEASKLSSFFRGQESVRIIEAINSALLMGDHSELYEFASSLHMDRDELWRTSCHLVCMERPDLIADTRSKIEKRLKELEK